MSERCSKRVYSGERSDWGGHLCGRTAKQQLPDGKWVCAIHSPEATAKREAKSAERYEAIRKADHARWDRDKYDKEAGDMCRSLGIIDPKLICKIEVM